jgi:hypothetical protein
MYFSKSARQEFVVTNACLSRWKLFHLGESSSVLNGALLGLANVTVTFVATALSGERVKSTEILHRKPLLYSRTIRTFTRDIADEGIA